MFLSVIVAVVLLVCTPFVLSRFVDLPKNVKLLFVAQPLVMSASPVIVFIGGILSTQLASDPKLATLPLTLMILGVASASIPAAMLAKYKGRKFATLTGFACAFLASILAIIATQISSFELFMLASLFFGFSTSFVQQLRFAAIESTQNLNDVPKILSVLMLSGLFAAFLGPEVAVVGMHIIDSPHGFTGSFAILSLLIVMAALVMTGFKNPEMQSEKEHTGSRPFSTIIKQPIFIIALLTGAIGYALMSYLMTATPLSMHQMNGHSLEHTKLVIQSHIGAMFIPSLFTTWLVNKFGIKTLMLTGTILYAVVILIALSGEQVLHYWWVLVLLGVGWNFLFLSGTTLLPYSYKENEKHKVQATNDFILFGLQALASLMAGWTLFNAGWNTVVMSAFPFVITLFIVSIYFYRKEKALAHN
mgnify:CR=1 FL=1